MSAPALGQSWGCLWRRLNPPRKTLRVRELGAIMGEVSGVGLKELPSAAKLSFSDKYAFGNGLPIRMKSRLGRNERPTEATPQLPQSVEKSGQPAHPPILRAALLPGWPRALHSMEAKTI
jgi:hypothetical protein